MSLNLIIGLTLATILVGLIAGAVVIRRRQRTLNTRRDAAQLQRRADHLFKIALAAQVHTRDNTIARVLLEDAIRTLEYSRQLDPQAELTANSLRECHDLMSSIEAEPAPVANTSHDALLDFPETELIEAQLHLTEATRLLIGLEKRAQISYDTLSNMTVSLRQAQRAIDLRLQLQRATRVLDGDRHLPKSDEVRAGEYLAAQERNRA